MSESARSILKHLYKEGRMTEEQYQKIDRNLKGQPQWIPCSERLPEKDGKYLVTMKGWESKKLMVTTSIFANSTKEFYPNCIAWTPLPEPYNGGEAE